MSNKNALVISGGGSKGAYAVGVLDTFNQKAPNLKFDVFVGTSTGSLITPFMALGRLSTLIHIYTTTTTDMVVRQKNDTPSFNQSSLYSTAPLFKLINDNLSDNDCMDLINSPDKEIHLITTCLQTEKPTIFSNRDLPASKSGIYDVIRFQNGEHFKKAMLASANQPVFMPPVRVNRGILNGPEANYQYVDGGVMDYAGIEIGMDSQADNIYTIYLSKEGSTPDTKMYTNLLKILGETVGILTGNVGTTDLRIPHIQNTALEYIQQAKDNLLNQGVSQSQIDQAFNISIPNQEFLFRPPYKMHMIRPTQELKAGAQGLDFNPTDMKAMMKLGREDGQQFLDGLAITCLLYTSPSPRDA